MGIMAIMFLIIGLTLIIGHNITLLHSYHYKNVKEEDKKSIPPTWELAF